MEKKTLADLVDLYPEDRAEETVLTFLAADGAQLRSLSFRELKEECHGVAAGLAPRASGNKMVLLSMEEQDHFVTGFFGCILAGLIPIPLPAIRNGRDETGWGRLLRITRDTGAETLLVSPKQRETALQRLAEQGLGGVRVLDIETLSHTGAFERYALSPGDIAYIQYTSGSTADPRGVVLTHEQVLANLGQMYRVFGRKERVRVAGWIPFHHDMGLVGHLFTVLFEAGFGVFLPAPAFLTDPGLWLRTIADYRANSAAAPTFAFEHCWRKVSTLPSIDLGCWKYAYVGSETVAPEVLDRFSERFSALGFDPNAFKPVYGLAEATLLVAGGGQGLEDLRPAFSGVGRTLMAYALDKETNVTIQDPLTGEALSPGMTGEIAIAGKGRFSGYLGQARPTGPFFATGDLGFVSGDYLYVTGRRKDVVIIRGVNFSAEDLEFSIRQGQDLLQSNDRAVCVSDLSGEKEAFFVFQEVHRHSTQETLSAVTEAIRANLGSAYGILPDEIVLIPNGCMPRTSNYKIARHACLQKYLDGELPVLKNTGGGSFSGPGDERAADPVVIVGMSCRFPGGADDPERFWTLLSEGADAIREVPAERWDNAVFFDPRPAVPGKVNTRWAGFIDDIDQFDPGLFGISRHEAPELDPQQRLLLETSWRLLENAGWSKDRIKGSDTGVFVGLSTNDYLYMKIKLIPGMESFNAYSGLGNANSIAANRLSYFYDLKGPSLAVDTACSSSLTALHLGSRAILNGDCTQAIVGGVNAILSPGPTITLSQFGMMSPDGRCKTFDAGADGYVRSEGCGLVLLKRLSAAVRDGDRILAVLNASSTGQDGHSNGITFPNGDAQRRLLAKTLKEARLKGGDVSYIEAHGTGTAAGDPVEVEQLAAVYGAPAPAPCYLGSVKANIGHLEACAGIASVIKGVLMLQKQRIPPQIHVKQLNPRIALQGTRFRIADHLTDWTPVSGKRRVAVSSFGFGGALAHAILEEPPVLNPAAPAVPALTQQLFVLSGHSPQALRAQAEQWMEWLETKRSPLSIGDICYTQALGRSHQKYRRHFLATGKAALGEKLKTFLRVQQDPASHETDRLCFLFTGQGEHYLHMGRELYYHFPVFKNAFDRCAAEWGPTLKELAFDLTDTTLWTDDAMQPILFAVQYSLGILLQECGCIPHALLGHSLGEYAAACLAGCFEPETGMRILRKRAELIGGLEKRGIMATLFTDEATVRAVMDASRACIAAVNSSKKTVVSGELEEIHRLIRHFRSANTEVYILKTQQAYHSLIMDPILESFREFLQAFHFNAPAKKWISSLRGKEMTQAPDAGHWVDHLRHTVAFARAVSALPAEERYDFIEVGPGSSTLVAVSECRDCRDARMLRTLNIKKGDRTEGYFLLDTLGQLYTSGASLRLEPVLNGGFYPDQVPGQRFMHQSYWIDGLSPERLSAFAGNDPSLHYRVTWIDQGRMGEEGVNGKDVNWLLVGPSAPLLEDVGRIAKAQGAPVFRIQTQTTEKAEYRKILDKIVHLRSKEGSREWKMLFMSEQLGAFIPLLQALKEIGLALPVWVVCKNSQYVEGHWPEKKALNLDAAPLWGFAKTLFLEHPEWRGGLIDVDEAEGNGPLLLQKILQPKGAHCIAVRQGRQFIPQIAPLSLPADASVSFRTDGAYIITGGFGGLGLACAEWLVSKGIRRLVLIGRRMHPDAEQRLSDLRASGAELEFVLADVRDEAAVERLFRTLDEKQVPVRGILHAAGVNWFSKIMDLDGKTFLETLDTKVAASWTLHRLSADRDLDCFILFSSVSAIWGSVDLSHYTAANHYMDALSLYRSGLGLKTCCINWGPWAEVGMSSKVSESEVLQKLGFRLMKPEVGLKALDKTLAASLPLSTVVDLDWEKYRLFIDFSLQPSLFGQVAPPGEKTGSPAAGNLDRILSSPPEAAMRQIEEVVRTELRMVMLIESMDTIDEAQRFNFLGMDSLMAITFAARLEQYFNCPLPNTLAYNYPTIGAVRDFVFESVYRGEKAVVDIAPPDQKSFVLLKERESPSKVQLFCFPYAGSGASAYGKWAETFGEQVELIAVQPKGREERSDESPFTSLVDLAQDLLHDFTDPDAPFYFFGHSLGALMAYELYNALKESGRRLPVGLFLCGCAAPLRASGGKVHLLEETEFIEEVLKNYGAGVNVGDRRTALHRNTGLLRADLQALECYQPRMGRIAVPLLAIAGLQDQLAPPEEVEKWNQLSDGDFSIHYLNGGHDLVKENGEDLAYIIKKNILWKE